MKMFQSLFLTAVFLHLIDFSLSLDVFFLLSKGIFKESNVSLWKWQWIIFHIFILRASIEISTDIKNASFSKIYFNTFHFSQCEMFKKISTLRLAKNGLIWKKFVGYKLFHLRDITTTLIERVNYQQYGDDVIHGVHTASELILHKIYIQQKIFFF